MTHDQFVQVRMAAEEGDWNLAQELVDEYCPDMEYMLRHDLLCAVEKLGDAKNDLLEAQIEAEEATDEISSLLTDVEVTTEESEVQV